jgi:hypothetical protein
LWLSSVYDPHRDRVLAFSVVEGVRLGQNIVRDHAPRLADIKLVRPVPGVRELVAGETEPTERFPVPGRDAGIVCEGPVEALLVGHMRLEHPLRAA